jgi:phenylpyruvate tautomerase PptA (4-oxalocrotonate tautomerase family)
MFLIHVKTVEGALTGPQRQQLLDRLTSAVLASAGESVRARTWCLVEEIPEHCWAMGGETASLDDMRALAREDG